ncbi:YveK family protein [Kocuria rosea]|nr:Wzz/FepE/Etk N-terminal domain-containing protein [Kocuria rosea]
MDVQDYATALRDKWWMVAALGLLGLVAGIVFAFMMTSQYRAVSSVYLQVPLNDNPSVLSQVSGYMEHQSNTYAELADKPLIQTQVVEQLGLDVDASEMIGVVSAAVPENTYSINIAAETEDERQSIDIVNATAAELVTYVNSSEPQMDGEAMVRMTVSAPATQATSELPASAAFPIGGLLLGLLGGAMLAVILWNRQSRIDVPTEREHGLTR